MKKYFVMAFVKVFLIIINVIIILEVAHRFLNILDSVNIGNILQLAAVIVLLAIGMYLFIFLFRNPIIQITEDELINNIPFSKQHRLRISDIEKLLFYNTSLIQLLMYDKQIKIIKIHLLSNRDKNFLIDRLHRIIEDPKQGNT